MEPHKHVDSLSLENPLTNPLLTVAGDNPGVSSDGCDCIGCFPELVSMGLYTASDFADLYVCENCRRQVERNLKLH